jgi:glycosyltransferase involved in cell wall biosynthesis
MIAFVQPFGLNSLSGGARIMRALLEDAPEPFVSVCTSARPPAKAVMGEEEHLPIRPYFGAAERTRLHRAADMATFLFRHRFEERFEDLCRRRNVRLVHSIPHGLAYWHAFRVARRLEIPFVLNVHDDLPYNVECGPVRREAMKQLGTVWREANARFVISEAMGNEYDTRYGRRPWEVMTDGLPDELPERPRPSRNGRMSIYFMGALHISYHPNFRGLLEAVAAMRNDAGVDASIISRGSPLVFPHQGVPVETLPFASERELERDFDRADILYLPLPFGEKFESFSRFSLSTKMVSYLGTGVPILYHGPGNAAAAQMLKKHDAAAMAVDNLPATIRRAIEEAVARRDEIVGNALRLGREEFRLSRRRRRFWEVLSDELPSEAVLASSSATST